MAKPKTKTSAAPADFNEIAAAAIDVIHAVRFVAGRKTASPEYSDVRAIAALLPHGVHLRIFQKHGISSTVVAEALRAGVLTAKRVEL